MKKLYALLFVLVSSYTASAQSDSTEHFIAFHPAVGKTIDAAERKSYGLFRDYSDSLFKEASLIKVADTVYTLRITTVDGHSYDKPSSVKELDGIYAKVDIISAERNEIRAKKAAEEEHRRRQKEAETEEWIEFGANMFIGTLEVLCWFLEAAN